MRHKHADAIHAWAEGFAIESRLNNPFDWHDDEPWELELYPEWDNSEYEFRIMTEELQP